MLNNNLMEVTEPSTDRSLTRIEKAFSGDENLEAPINNSENSSDNVRKIVDHIIGYRAAKVLFTALSIDLFEQFQKSAQNIDKVAKNLSLDTRACEMFLDALVSLGYLEKQNGWYSNTNPTKEFLLKDSPFSVFYNLRYQDKVWQGWSELSETLKRGQPRAGLLERLRDPNFTSDYIKGMGEIARISAPRVSEIISRPTDMRFLDVGAGAGSYTVSLLSRNPNVKAVVLDLPETLEVTKTLISNLGDRVRFLPGNYHHVDFGKNEFDLILMSHVTHDEDPKLNKDLFYKARKALKPDGWLAIHDFMLEKNRTSPLYDTLLCLHMLGFIENARVYCIEEYESWLREVGLQKIDVHRISSDNGFPETKVIIARS